MEYTNNITITKTNITTATKPQPQVNRATNAKWYFPRLYMTGGGEFRAG